MGPKGNFERLKVPPPPAGPRTIGLVRIVPLDYGLRSLPLVLAGDEVMKNRTLCVILLLPLFCALAACSDSDQTDETTDATADQGSTEDSTDPDAVEMAELTDTADLTDARVADEGTDQLDGLDSTDADETTDTAEIREDPDGWLDVTDADTVDTGETVGLIVNSLLDLEEPREGVVTLRAALAEATPSEVIRFAPSLDGGVIELSIVGEEHTTLKGEVMGMRFEPSGPVSYLEGYFNRDYGRSALYSTRDVFIDASDLPSGITIAWTGGRDAPARVLAVYGDLNMRNVTVTGGYSVTEELVDALPGEQPWTLARGGGVAVWGRARLNNCTFYDNHCEGDTDPSRDRGAGGGGVYANIVEMEDCVVSGNTVGGGGASGGGVYSVGGAESAAVASTIDRSSITGNRISAPYAYGAGVYSDGGGIGNAKYLVLRESTIARNVVEPPPGAALEDLGRGYWRGGGAYMSNGFLHVHGCTIVENEVYGVARTDALGKPNLAGGVAATIGNAHAVERMVISHSIIAGNTVFDISTEPAGSYGHDIFTGSLLHFESLGYNRLGVVDFSQILVPVGEPGWESLIRRHYPQIGDEDGVTVTDVLDLSAGVAYSETILSAGVDAANPTVLHYQPTGTAVDQIPPSIYRVDKTYGEYWVAGDNPDSLLAIILARIETQYGLSDQFTEDFTDDFETFLQSVDLDDDTDGLQPYTDPDGDPIQTLAETQWFGPAETWNKELPNYPYIEFWHRLDEALDDEDIAEMGPEGLGEQAWEDLFDTGVLSENPYIFLSMHSVSVTMGLSDADQLDTARPVGELGDIGAIELR